MKMIGFKSSSTKYVIMGLILLAVIVRGFAYPQKESDYFNDDETNYDDNESEHVDQENSVSAEQNHAYFAVKGVNQTFIPNKDVILDCPVQDLGSKSVILWFRGVETIVNGPTALKAKYKVEGENKTKLRIISAAASDAGVYKCTILPNNISLNINLEYGTSNEIKYDEVSGGAASLILSYSTLLTAAVIAAVFLRI